MQFKIKHLILWPKNEELEIVDIKFSLNKVDVITGGSSRGKSAILNIIDYCLGAGTCRIPTRTIRDKTAWFGIIVELQNNATILLGRQDPSISTTDMYFRESIDLEIPSKLISNIKVNEVKNRLDDLAGLTRFGFSDSVDSPGFKSRPSFRDLIAFNFQPQHLIANQSTLFYKTDIFQHREKLRTILPYVLGAVDDDYLKSKDEIKDLKADLNSLTKEFEKRTKLVGKWIAELRSNYVRAIEFGLLLDTPFPDDSWAAPVYINYLKQVSINFNGELPTIKEGVSSRVSDRVNQLNSKEIELSHQLHVLKHRYELIRKIEESSKEYRDSLVNQHERLKTVSWFNKYLEDKTSCPLCGNENNNAVISVKKLLEANKDILRKGARINDNYNALSLESRRVKKDISEAESSINILRKEMDLLRSSDAIANARLQNVYEIFRFVGSLESEIKNYEELNDNRSLQKKIQDLQDQIEVLENAIDETKVNRKMKSAKKIISKKIEEYAELFKAEYSKDAINFDENNLSLDFLSRDGRENKLFEIGGGENYMAYHISTLLALHEFFLDHKNSPVPSFIVFDQPSQVYFPDKSESEDTKDEDVQKVKRIFDAFSQCLIRTSNKLQIIVVEHVGDYAWSDLKNVNKLRRWRGEENNAYLVPRSWL